MMTTTTMMMIIIVIIIIIIIIIVISDIDLDANANATLHNKLPRMQHYDTSHSHSGISTYLNCFPQKNHHDTAKHQIHPYVSGPFASNSSGSLNSACQWQAAHGPIFCGMGVCPCPWCIFFYFQFFRSVIRKKQKNR